MDEPEANSIREVAALRSDLPQRGDSVASVVTPEERYIAWTSVLLAPGELARAARDAYWGVTLPDDPHPLWTPAVTKLAQAILFDAPPMAAGAFLRCAYYEDTPHGFDVGIGDLADWDLAARAVRGRLDGVLSRGRA